MDKMYELGNILGVIKVPEKSDFFARGGCFGLQVSVGVVFMKIRKSN
jgi:hypothetical protein